jgi:hypothetical protein
MITLENYFNDCLKVVYDILKAEYHNGSTVTVGYQRLDGSKIGKMIYILTLNPGSSHLNDYIYSLNSPRKRSFQCGIYCIATDELDCSRYAGKILSYVSENQDLFTANGIKNVKITNVGIVNQYVVTNNIGVSNANAYSVQLRGYTVL